MTADAQVSGPRLNRALPGWAVDAIQLGVPRSDSRDPRKAWTMAMRIAMSAYLRGWSEGEYQTQVSLGMKVPARGYENGLWQQLTTRPDGRRHPDRTGYKALQSAWKIGVANANGTGVRSKEDIAVEAANLAARWVDRITDGDDGLSAEEAAVMGYVIAETDRRGYLKVTCPGREVAEFAKISHRTAARVLSRMNGRGLLIKHSGGRRGANSGKAAIYGLAEP